jgi:predicted RNA binding protein YcfA (HicA-like mRNA interferase family)
MPKRSVESRLCLVRSKGSHPIYAKGGRRVVVPFHSNATLHPKIVKPVLDVIEEASIQAMPPE